MKLYDYQLDAIERMKNGCILCGSVGSGKSLTALAYYYLKMGGDIKSITGSSYILMKRPKDLYIITTARKRDSLEWDKELIHFRLNRNPEFSLYSNQVVVDSWNNIKKYEKVTNAFFIFDEQRVIGRGTWVKSFLKIAKANSWILLSATPGDTWSDYIPVFVANGFFRNRTEFYNEHVVWAHKTNFPKISRYLNTRRLIRLRESILVGMDYVKPTNSIHKDIFTTYDLELYRDVSRRRWDPYKDEPIATASGLCYIWRKIVNSDESKEIALLELFEKHPKMIVFYNFDYELYILRDMVFPGAEVAEWNGHKHQEMPEGDSWVYLVQYNAGSEGWNCIKTDTIVFFSPSYSYKMMQQAAGRIDRLNSPYENLYYYHLKTKSGIDLAISRALKNKKDFNAGRFVKW